MIDSDERPLSRSFVRRERDAPLGPILARAAAGERAAIDALCERLRPYALACVRREMGPRVRRWESADALATEGSLDVIASLAGGSRALNEPDLLARVRRTAGWRVRDAARRHERSLGESAAHETPPRQRASLTETHPAIRRERSDRLRSEIRALSAVQRDAVELCGLHELSFVEAARLRGLLPDTIRKRYVAALAALRRRCRQL